MIKNDGGVAIVACFSTNTYHAFRRDKGQSTSYPTNTLLTPYQQERILKVVEFGRVRRPVCCARYLADGQTDRVTLWLDPNDHLHWLHQELASAHVHKVRLFLVFPYRAHPPNRLISPLA